MARLMNKLVSGMLRKPAGDPAMIARVPLLRTTRIAMAIAIFAGSAIAFPGRHRTVDPVFETFQPISSPMRKFGDTNPACGLWTDWHQLCSRTGKDGSPRCSIDPAASVKPSAPFCASVLTDEDELQARSRDRFCDIYLAGSGSAGDRGPTPRPCLRYKANRPFNGLRIAALRHPQCQSWSDAQTGNLVCSEDGRGKGPRCATLAVKRYVSSHPLFCSRWTDRPICPSLRTTYDRPKVEAGGIVLTTRPSPDGVAAHGISCGG